VKYYEPEHAEGYERIRAEGKSAWGQLHGEATFEDSEIRGVLAEVLSHLYFDTPHPAVLEYGCGTGPGACLLVERGMRVHGIDQSAVAIEIARSEAAKRGLTIDYRVGDVCTNIPLGDKYDLVVDSFCLQCIVTDDDRDRLFTFVKGALKPSGRYVIATAGYSPARDYGDAHFDRATGIVLDGDLPCRRHVTAGALVRELAVAGFTVEWHRTAPDGDVALIARLSPT
jgi:SAM-dependent methyltransferase